MEEDNTCAPTRGENDEKAFNNILTNKFDDFLEVFDQMDDEVKSDFIAKCKCIDNDFTEKCFV